MSATGPFIVSCTKVPEHDGATGYVSYREAFAALGDSDRAVARICEAAGYSYRDLRAASNSYEDRNTLTLPNGDVIEVEATTADALWSAISLPARRYVRRGKLAAILAAWNAEHGIGIGERA